MKIALIVLDIIISIALIVVVLLQSGKEAGLGAITGGNSESYMSKNKRASLDKKLAVSTKWLALAFVLVTLALVLVIA